MTDIERLRRIGSYCRDEDVKVVMGAASEIEKATGYAQRLATSLWEQHFRQDAPDWKPLPDLIGVLTQIDNMTTGLERREAAAEIDAVLGGPEP